MRYLFCFCMLTIACKGLFAQQASGKNTYALVVGISTYATGNDIPSLKYAHKDAKEFADYLRSPSGGSVPPENIRLLLNEDANMAAVYQGLDWLTDSVKHNALVYIYFAGHGDKQTKGYYNLGFLLTYNTPRSIYLNNALRIEDLNNAANTLSINNKDNVILITDACHSGDVAGKGFRSAGLAGENLRTVQHHEIRITSCDSNQLAAEDKGWGGGRGVFSWYLLKGLTGKADRNNDYTVSLKEIKTWLDSCFSKDRILATLTRKQTPVLKGDDDFPLALVDKKALALMSARETMQPMVRALAPLPPQPMEYFFDQVNQKGVNNIVDFARLDKMPKDSIPLALIDFVKEGIWLIEQRKPYEEMQTDFYGKLTAFSTSLMEDKERLSRFKEKLVELIHNHGQDIINLYLKGDAAELERREYYNKEGKGYDYLPKMFSVALKLADPHDELYRVLEVDMNYFTAVVARLKIPFVKDPHSLIDAGMTAIKKALALREYPGANIYNELGILYTLKKDYTHAEQNFLRATEMTTEWGIPWSNLAYLYTLKGQYDKARYAIDTAKVLQPGLQSIYLNEGTLYQKKGELLQSEESFGKCIRINALPYLPFEYLGQVYLNTTRYEMSNSAFAAAVKRKKMYGLWHSNLPDETVERSEHMHSIGPFPLEEYMMGTDNIMGLFCLGLMNLKRGEKEGLEFQLKAETYFKAVIKKDNTNPLAWHYLADVLNVMQRKQEAEAIYQEAIRCYMDRATFDRYCDSLNALPDSNLCKKCVADYFRSKHYYKAMDHYSLASIYESRNNYSGAEDMYHMIANMDPENPNPSLSLALMLEKIRRYKDAEKLLRSYAAFTKTSEDLTGFFDRMIGRFPDVAEWYYKAGEFLYARLADSLPDENNIIKDPEASVPANIIREMIFADTTGNALIKPAELRAAIVYLTEAGRLSPQDEDGLLDISYKLAELYTRAQIPEKAARYYKNALDLDPQNAGARLKLVDAWSRSYHLLEARDQLDSLYTRQEINFPKQKLLAIYYMHARLFSKADSLLQDLKTKMLLKDPELTELEGRLQLLSGHPKEALSFYEEVLSLKPGDVSILYSIARINAQLKNTGAALKWLETALSKGFSYYYVLAVDPSWKSYRDSPSWKKLMTRFPAMVENQ